jgi:hypothetical protein
MTILGKYFETESLGHDQYQTTIGLKPINYQDGSVWKRIVNNWGDSGIGERPHIVSAAPFITSVSPDGLRRIHPTREDDIWFEMSGAKINQAGTWNVIQLGTPTSRVDNRIIWNRINFNAYMDMAGHYVKLGYLLKNGYLPPNNQFAFEVATNGLTRQGGILLKDGVPVMHMRKPIAYDYDNPDDIRQIAHEIVRIDGKWHVVFTLPDLTGMSKPLIDPTLTLQPDATAGIDNWIREGEPTFNYGISGGASTGTEADNKTRRCLIQFDISSLPAGATLSSAVLTLHYYYEEDAADEGIGTHRGLVEWYEGIKDGAAPGAEDGSTWGHRNANSGGQVAWAGGAGGVSGTEWTAVATDTQTITSIPADYDFAVLADVQAWYDGSSNYGWWLINTDESHINTLKNHRSSDYGTAADRPKLVINYSEAGGAGARILNLMPMRRKRRVL